MNKLATIGIVLLGFGFLLGCSESPLQTDNASVDQVADVAEFQAIESELNSVGLNEPDGTPIEITDKMIERLGRIIERMKNVQERFSTFQERFDNDEAKVLIEEAASLRNEAIEAYDAGDYETAFNSLHDARDLMHSALEIVRPEGLRHRRHHNRPKGKFVSTT